ncbi:9106_t:CDS:2, partial [Entrophospora sp. SA101]
MSPQSISTRTSFSSFISNNDSIPQRNNSKSLFSSSTCLKIKLMEPALFLRGNPQESLGCFLRGELILILDKPTKIKKLDLKFNGKSKTFWPEGRVYYGQQLNSRLNIIRKLSSKCYTILQPNIYTFPFELFIPGDSPTICDEPDPNDLSKSRCIGKFQVPTELLDAPITERLNFSLPDKRYGIQFLINITDAEYNPKYDNGIVIKAYDQEFNPHRLPEAVGNLVNKLDPYFIERLDSLNFHIMTYHQTREFLITSFWEMLGLPPYYFLQPYIDSRIEYIRIPSIIDQFATSNYGILFVGTLNWIETIENKDVSGLMEFLGPILLRSTNSIKKDEENDTPNSSTTKISLPPTEDKNRL